MTWMMIAAMVFALFLIPVGLPGLWILIGVDAVSLLMGHIGIGVVVTAVVIALVAELIELFIVKRLTKQYGGSPKSFWGAIGGGLIGVVVGVPVPVIGSVIGGLVGSFVGAALVTYAETRKLSAAHRVGWGAVIGRALSAVTKTAAGLTIFVITTAALLH